MKILIDALYVKKGGGLTVLIEFLKFTPKRGDIDILIDESLRNELTIFNHQKFKIIWEKSSFYNKIYFYNRSRYAAIFALGNFPGLAFYNTNLLVYNMQYFLFDRSAIQGKLKVIWFLKHIVIRILFALSNPYLIVQTDWMKIIASKSGFSVKDIYVVPIYKDELNFTNTTDHISTNFLYITSDYPYKNNHKIVEIFERIGNVNLYITIDGCSKKNIHFLGNLKHDLIIECINEHRPTIIQASDVESFGITLIEAALSNSPLLVLDRPYVDSVVSECSKFSNWNQLEEIIINKTPIKVPNVMVKSKVKKIWQLLERM